MAVDPFPRGGVNSHMWQHGTKQKLVKILGVLNSDNKLRVELLMKLQCYLDKLLVELLMKLQCYLDLLSNITGRWHEIGDG
jgi:hypothetical protein